MAPSIYYISSFSFSGFDPVHKISVPNDEQTSPGLHTQNQEPNPQETVIASSKINVSSHFPKMEPKRDMAARTIVSSGPGESQSSTSVNTIPKRVISNVFSSVALSNDIFPLVDITTLDHSFFPSSMKPEEWEEMRLPQENEIDDLLNSVYGTSFTPSMPKEETARDLPQSCSSDQASSSSLIPLEMTQSNIFSEIDREPALSPPHATISQTSRDFLATPAFEQSTTTVEPTFSAPCEASQESTKSSSSKKRKVQEKIQQGPDQRDFAEINIQRGSKLEEECGKRQRILNEETDTASPAINVNNDISSKSENSIPKWLFTESGKRIVNYFNEAIESDRWRVYFTKKVRHVDIQIDYLTWCMNYTLDSVFVQDLQKIHALLSRFAYVIHAKQDKQDVSEWYLMMSKEECLTRIRKLSLAVAVNCYQ